MIQNFEELATTQKKKDTLEILESGLHAASPENFLSKFVAKDKIIVEDETLNLDKFSAIYTVAFGKAADSMTRAVNAIVPVKAGIVVIQKVQDQRSRAKNFRFLIQGIQSQIKLA